MTIFAEDGFHLRVRVLALGHLLTEILLDGGARTVDVRALRPERFREGEPNPAPVLL